MWEKGLRIADFGFRMAEGIEHGAWSIEKGARREVGRDERSGIKAKLII
jgi:hypothetical protein